MKIQRKPFILEIGVEEIPVSYINPALSQLNEEIDTVLYENEIDYEKLCTFGTPYRLVVYIEKINIEKPARKETIKGPPVEVAYNEKGKPTRAACGFAKKFKANINDLKKCSIDRGEYVCIEREFPAVQSSKILSDALPEIIRKIHFPKRMRWTNCSFSFARPIRWICSLLAEKVVVIDLGCVVSDRYSFVNFNRNLKKIKLKDTEDYFMKLKQERIILNQEERKKFLTSRIEKIAEKNNGQCLKYQKNLLEEVIFLTETPTVFCSNFNEDYLKLPQEVLLASMSKYQRVFGVIKKDRKLLPLFIGVLEGEAQDLTSVKKNYRMVLESRLDDSLFFFRKDTAVRLRHRVEKLGGIIYHNRLGTVLEKVKRMDILAQYIAKKIGLNSNLCHKLHTAVMLCKADLTTDMVNEFTSLQGVMGKIYAEIDREDKEVYKAIFEHYLPRHSTDFLPSGILGCIISLSDRIDSLVGHFGINIIPTGSYDPYGLRRDSFAIIKIIIDQKLSLNLDRLIQESIKLLKNKLEVEEERIKKTLINFIKDKLYSFLFSSFKRSDLLHAVLENDNNNIIEIYEILDSLNSVQEEDFFKQAAKVSERTKKIYKYVEDDVPDKVNESLIKEDSEKDLWLKYNDIEKQLIKTIEKKDYKEATRIYADSFYDIVHVFFDKVLVNVEDSRIRRNRLALCKKVHDIYNSRVAQLSLLENIKVD